MDLKLRLFNSVAAKDDEKEKSQGTPKTKKTEVFDYRGKDIFPDWLDCMDKVQNKSESLRKDLRPLRSLIPTMNLTL